MNLRKQKNDFHKITTTEIQGEKSMPLKLLNL